jgi:hypothetical protein
VGETPRELGHDLWRWTAPHPEWHPGEFGREVACFAVRAGGDTILIDPLLPADPASVLELVERTLGQRLTILVTIPYHVRSSEEIWRAFRDRTAITIRGHPSCGKRLEDQSGFRAFEPGDELPAGVSAHRIGRPRRFETPLHIPSHRALVFGDAVAEVDGALRVWSGSRAGPDVSRFYRERFNPTLEPLLDLDFDRVLVTHGQPVMRDGRAQLQAALRADPWSHRP